MDGDPTPALTGRRRTRPTSIGCRNPWQPKPCRAPLSAAQAAVHTDRATSLLTPSLGRRTSRGLIKPRLGRRTLTRTIGHSEHVLSSFQRYELGLREGYPVAMALGHAGEVVNRGLSGLPAMADREIQGMEVGVLAHALPALLGR